MKNEFVSEFIENRQITSACTLFTQCVMNYSARLEENTGFENYSNASVIR